MASRFAEPVSDAKELSLRAGAIPQNTKASTEWGIRIWEDWAVGREGTTASVDGVVPLTTPLLGMSRVDLGYWMSKFVLEVRKKDGSEYPPKSLYAIVCCFKCYFEQNSIHDINPLRGDDATFGNFRVTLDAEMKRLHGMGLGTSTKQAEPITSDEESILWSAGQLGIHTAKALFNIVYYYNCKIFGLRSYDEHRNLQCAQFEKKVDEKDRVYLEYTDYGSKTNRGGLKHMKVDNKKVRQYENLSDPDHCVVNIFVKYFDVIPSQTSHFYFRPLPNDATGMPRFGKQPVGRNTLARVIPDMCKAAGIEGRKTGHSGKVTCATTLYHQNFSDQLIKERTGHRSLEALHKYKRTGSDQQYEVSMALLPPLSDLVNKKPVASAARVESCRIANGEGKENNDDDEDFVPLKKKPKFNPEAMFPQSNLTNCTFNFSFGSK